VLVEARWGERNPLQIVAAYIDLNPVRAGLVAEARDYPHSGFGSAGMGNVDSQRGVVALCEVKNWAEARAHYERFLAGKFTPGGTDVTKSPATQPPDSSLGSALRSRQSSLVKGFVIGSATFVMEILMGLAEIRASVRPQAYASGGMGGDLWVGRRFRKDK
jgi:hypothetical protein